MSDTMKTITDGVIGIPGITGSTTGSMVQGTTTTTPTTSVTSVTPVTPVTTVTTVTTTTPSTAVTDVGGLSKDPKAVFARINERKEREAMAIKEFEKKVTQMKVTLDPLAEEITKRLKEAQLLNDDIESIRCTYRQIMSQTLSNNLYQIPYRVGQLISVSYGNKTMHSTIKSLATYDANNFTFLITNANTDFGSLDFVVTLICPKFEESTIQYNIPNSDKTPIKSIKILCATF